MDLDIISPPTIGEDRIGVQLSAGTSQPRVGTPVTVEFDYADADQDGGCVLPIVASVQPPTIDGRGYKRKVFGRALPLSFTFVPETAGEHLVVVRESAHNRWQGRLVVVVVGDDLSGIATERMR